MTYFTGLRLLNWLPYRGEHVLELEPKVYAVEAQFEDDPERSNWGGKSSLTWAVRFLKYGEHPKKTEDGFITGDEALGIALEKEGGVEGELSDGVFISRLRKRGSKTALYVEAPSISGETLELRDAAAQNWLIERYGFNDGDAEMTWWMQQAEADKMLRIDPAELMGIVSEWFAMQPLERAADYVAGSLSKLLSEEMALHSKATALVQERAGLCWWSTELEFEAQQEHLLSWINAAGEAGGVVETAARDEERRARDEIDARRLVAIDAELKQLKAMVEVLAIPVSDEVYQALLRTHEAETEALAYARAEADTKRRLARGEFDGRCPVGGVQCPITKQLNAGVVESGRAFQVAEQKREAAIVAKEQARRAAQEAAEERESHKRRKERIAELERERPVLLDGAARHLARAGQEEPGALPVSRDAIVAVQRAGLWERKNNERARERVAVIDVELKSIERQLSAVESEIVHVRAGVLVLGRNGAQRRVAEGRLAVIEQSGNKVLTKAGVELSFALEWSRPTKAPARNCYACGAAFPKTTTVKECSFCGQARGKQLEEKLRLVPSRSSGGAGYLACIGLRLAAFAWLKRKRGSDWGVACLDELFGALDGHNKRALADHLAAMLRVEYGIEQAFVIAHDAGILDGLPGKIRITAGRAGSSVRVV